jgi:outer membrane protein OmpA-like peptidoglycan-associated protein
MRRVLLGLAVCLLAASGCRVSASAQGSVNSSADADAEASASATAPEPPPEPEPPAMATGQSITLNQGKLDYEGVINFEYDKADLRDDSETEHTLAEFKAFLEKHPEVSIEVEGHTDSRGSDEYNRDLSDRRAASVRAWLVQNGIAEERISSVGKGEDEPQVPEPKECDDRLPSDQSLCEAPWATNRRVVFQVTGGAETVEVAQVEPEPEPEPEPPPEPPPPPGCPWLYGGHANLLGPNSWVTLAGAVQPGICWLELSLGVGLGFGGFDTSDGAGGEAEGDYVSFTVPLRGRIWFMDRHSFIGDVGVGITHYRISADMTDAAGAQGDYTRNTTPLVAHLGVGYGFRPNSFEAGPRFALVVGPLFHLTDLGGSDVSPAGLGGAGLQQGMDDETDELGDVELYGEASFGWLF